MKQKVIFIGNIIVAGYPWNKGKSFVSVLRRALKGEETAFSCGDAEAVIGQPDFAKNTGFDIINKGVNGDTTAGIAGRFEADVLAGDPDCVYFMTGTNDFIYRDATPEKAFANLQELAEAAEARGITPIYMTPLFVDAGKAECMWMSGFGISYDAVNRDVNDFSELIRSSGRLYADMNRAFDEYAKAFDDIDLVYFDGVHPMPDGHAFMAGEVIRFIDENRNALGL